MSKAGAGRGQRQPLWSSAVLLHTSTPAPGICRLFPDEKDYLATKGVDSGQSVMSSYHRECGVQTLPSPLGTERSLTEQKQTLGHPKVSQACLLEEIPMCLYLWVRCKDCGCLCLSLEGVDFEHSDPLYRDQMSPDRTNMPAIYLPCFLPRCSLMPAQKGLAQGRKPPFIPVSSS